MNIVKKTPTSPATVWDPFRAMREMMRWDPFAQMAPAAAQSAPTMTFDPDFEVKETKEGYQFRADLPGIKEKDLEISMTGNRLTVSGHREAEKRDETDRYYVFERTYGSFARSFTLPDGIDGNKVVAELKDGVLTMLVPRSPETNPRKIAVKAPG